MFGKTHNRKKLLLVVSIVLSSAVWRGEYYLQCRKKLTWKTKATVSYLEGLSPFREWMVVLLSRLIEAYISLKCKHMADWHL